jgi:hypothetical protein
MRSKQYEKFSTLGTSAYTDGSVSAVGSLVGRLSKGLRSRSMTSGLRSAVDGAGTGDRAGSVRKVSGATAGTGLLRAEKGES